MKSGYDLEWTNEAERNLNDIFNYLEIMWTKREISNFARKLESDLQIIADCPDAFPYYDKIKNIRRCVLSPQTTIYYRAVPPENKVVIITLFDNRQNPSSLNI